MSSQLRNALMLSLVCLLRIAGSLHAQTPLFRSLSLGDSLASTTLQALAQSDDGFVWLATSAGAARYNGQSLAWIPGLPKAPATAVATLGKAVFFGYRDGSIYRYEMQRPPLLMLKDTSGAAITCLLPWSHGILAGTGGNGLWIKAFGLTYRLSTANGLTDDYLYAIQDIREGDEVRWLLASDNGIQVVSRVGHSLQVKSLRKSSHPWIRDNLITALQAHPGGLVAGTQDSGVVMARDSPGGWVPVALPKSAQSGGWQFGRINALLPAANGGAWLAATDSGLLRIRGPHYQLILNGPVRAMLRTRGGQVLAMQSRHLFAVQEGVAEWMDQPVAEGGTPIQAVAVSAQVAFLGRDSRVECRRLNDWSPLPGIQTAEPVTALCFDRQLNRLMVGTLGAGVLVLGPSAGQVWRPVQRLLDGEQILSLETGADGALWAATLNGVFVHPVSGTGYGPPRRYGRADGIGSDYVYCLHRDRAGQMWLATDGAGLCRFSGGRFIQEQAPLRAGATVFYTLTDDPSGNVWAGSAGHGLWQQHSGQWTRVAELDGIAGHDVLAVAAPDSHHVFVLTEAGIAEWMPGSRQARQWAMPVNAAQQAGTAMLNTAVADERGNVWIPVHDRVLSLPARGRLRPRPTGIRILCTRLFLNEVSPDSIVFAPGDNHLTFDFEGVAFWAADRLRYRYRLEGFDAAWKETGDRSVTFPRLPPGHYRFRVQAATNPGFTGVGEDSYAFRIERPFWQRVWFWALAALAFSAILYGLWRVRERRLAHLNRLREERLRFEYEYLKTQVNPHFLFNALNTLAGLIEENQDRATEYTLRLSALYRSIIQHAAKTTIPLEEELRLLEDYAYVQHQRFGEALVITNDIPPAVAAKCKVVPLALQMLVENAIKHNVSSVREPLVILLETDEAEQWLRVSNAIRPKISREPGAGLGLENIRSRYRLLTEKPVSAGEEEGHWVVTLPLL